MTRPQRQPMDQDRNVIFSVSTIDGVTPVPLEVNPVTGRLIVDSTGTITNTGTFPVQLNAYQTATTGSITTSTTTITVTDLMGVGGVTVSIFGTYSGVNVTFEQSTDNGTTWANATAVSTTTAAPQPFSGATGVLVTNSTNIWNVTPLLGVSQFRVRATAFGSGSASIRIDPSAQFTQPNVSSTITDGTNIVNVLKSDGTATGQNAVLTAPSYMSVAFTTTTVQSVGTTDVGNYASVSVYVATQGTSSSITFQTSNDNVNWSSNALEISSSSGTIIQTTATASITYVGALKGRYFRLNVTGISAGTTAGTIIFSTVPKSQLAVNANQNGTWTVGSSTATGSAVPANAFYQGGRDPSGNLIGIGADAARNLTVAQYATTPTLTNVASSATSVSLLVSNAAAKSRIIYNDSTQVLYVKYGTTASATSYTVQIAANGFFEFPQPSYTGAVDGIWASSNGFARVTEVI